MSGDFARALRQARTQGPEAMQALAEQHLPLVGAMVRRFPDDRHSREELYQQGVLGLMKALNRFDPDRGTSFSTYAAAMILGEMRMLRRLDAPIHIPRTEQALRSRVRQAEESLRSHLGRDPTTDELSAALHMDPAELMLHLEEVCVTSTDAATEAGTPLMDMLRDPSDWEQRLELKDILARLPKKDQQLVLLRYRVGLTQAETGKRLGMTQMQVSRREKVIQTLLRRALAE